MWVFTKHGFLSAVQSNDDRKRIRVRARRLRDLESAFPGRIDYIDLSESGEKFDYQWHLDIARGEWIDFLTTVSMDIDYSSHAKEAMTENDPDMYRLLLQVWNTMHRLQPRDGQTLPLGDDETDEEYEEWVRENARHLGQRMDDSEMTDEEWMNSLGERG